jgi:hypothetical protein
MSMAEYSGDFGTLRIETDMIDVTSSSPYADEDWTFTDAAGHQHRYDHGYPTLRWFVTERWWCEECDDEHTEGEWTCPLCDEVIVPGTAGPDLFRRYAPGRTSYLLNDQPISEDEARRIIEATRP